MAGTGAGIGDGTIIAVGDGTIIAIGVGIATTGIAITGTTAIGDSGSLALKQEQARDQWSDSNIRIALQRALLRMLESKDH